jgi:segregation and condensation protein A
MYKLITAFKRAISRIPKRIYHDIELLNVTIDEQISYIIDFFRVRDEGTFLELISHMTEKIRIIVTLIAMLELMKAQVLGIRPAEDSEDDFVVYKIKPNINPN